MEEREERLSRAYLISDASDTDVADRSKSEKKRRLITSISIVVLLLVLIASIFVVLETTLSKRKFPNLKGPGYTAMVHSRIEPNAPGSTFL